MSQAAEAGAERDAAGRSVASGRLVERPAAASGVGACRGSGRSGAADRVRHELPVRDRLVRRVRRRAVWRVGGRPLANNTTFYKRLFSYRSRSRLIYTLPGLGLR